MKLECGVADCLDGEILRFDALVMVEAQDGIWQDAILTLLAQADAERAYLWGVSFGGLEEPGEPEHLEMVIRAERYEHFILERMMREKRCGMVTALSPGRYLFTADVYDPQEMLPWIYSLTGRIESLSCSNPAVTKKFYSELEQMVNYYE